MYLPYLRGRLFECLALRALAEKMAERRNITPIIEPVNVDPGDVRRACSVLSSARVPHVVIHNPAVGALRDSYRGQTALLRAVLGGDETAIHGFLVHPGTDLADLNRFLENYGEERTAIIHWMDYPDIAGLEHELRAARRLIYNVLISPATSAAYRQLWNRKVCVIDGFQLQPRNADYPEDELFSKIYQTYEDEDCIGFGDFLTVGRRFLPGGGPAHAVVIHLTYERWAQRAIWTRHFVSDTTTRPPVAPGPKFLEALRKLVRFIDANGQHFYFSDACKQLRDLHGRGAFPGLGKVKELSMRHHIELMMHLQR